jgi:hypothetical protein
VESDECEVGPFLRTGQSVTEYVLLIDEAGLKTCK